MYLCMMGIYVVDRRIELGFYWVFLIDFKNEMLRV